MSANLIANLSNSNAVKRKAIAAVTEAKLPHLSFMETNRLVEKGLFVSQCEVSELSYEYSIPDLSFLTQKNGESYLTPTFFSKSYPEIQWQLKIFPKGYNKDTENYLSIFLQLKSSKDPPVVAVYKLTVINSDGVEVLSWLTNSPHPYTHSAPSFGWTKMASLDQLKGSQSNGLKLICQLICQVKRSWLISFTRYYYGLHFITISCL